MKDLNMKFATIIKPLPARFSKWEVGERVRVLSEHEGTVCIEKMQWRAPHVSLVNQCAGVPLASLQIEANDTH